MKLAAIFVTLFSTFVMAATPPPPITDLPDKYQDLTQKFLDLYAATKSQSDLSYQDLTVLIKAMGRVPARIRNLYVPAAEIKTYIANQRAAARTAFYGADMASRVSDDSLSPSQRLQACNGVSLALRNVDNFGDRGIYNSDFDDAYQGIKADNVRKAAAKKARDDLKARIAVNTTEYKAKLKACSDNYKKEVATLKAALKN